MTISTGMKPKPDRNVLKRESGGCEFRSWYVDRVMSTGGIERGVCAHADCGEFRASVLLPVDGWHELTRAQQADWRRVAEHAVEAAMMVMGKYDDGADAD